MMVNVQNGTDAGRRVIREKKRAWVHLCGESWKLGRFTVLDGGRLLEACYTRCPDCGRKRP